LFYIKTYLCHHEWYIFAGKVVYYKDNEMINEKCIGKVWTKPDNKYAKYHARFYPGDYEPGDNSYRRESLNESW